VTGRESWTEERTSPGAIERHPGVEGPPLSSLPPDADLRALVQQLQGGHTEIRGQVRVMQGDLSTLMRESRDRERLQETRHHETLGAQHRASWLTLIFLALGQAVQMLLSHQLGGH
jgi:hypothetical protein